MRGSASTSVDGEFGRVSTMMMSFVEEVDDMLLGFLRLVNFVKPSMLPNQYLDVS